MKETLRYGSVYRLEYDVESGRWVLGDCELHCGDRFVLFGCEGNEPIVVVIEMTRDGWYLITPYGTMPVAPRRAALLA